MAEYCTAAVCGQYKIIAFVTTVFVGVLITMLANWRRSGSSFRPQCTFVGAEMATAAIVAGVALLVEFGYVIWCADGTFSHFLRWANAYPGKAVEPVMILINLRFFRYCRNQEWRAVGSGMTYWRGMRNAFVGSLAFTLSLLAF
jgi:hypothetical protein